VLGGSEPRGKSFAWNPPVALWARAGKACVVRVFACLAVLCLSTACKPETRKGTDEPPPAASVSAKLAPERPSSSQPRGPSCDERLARSAVDRAGRRLALDARVRSELLASAKATPVVFLEEPRAGEFPEVASLWRKKLEQSDTPSRVIRRLFKSFPSQHEFVRKVLLTEHYLYAATPLLASALTDMVELHDLFREPQIVIERGAQRIVAVRNDEGRYEYASGETPGKARLFLFDRVYADAETLAPAKHVDVALLQRELGFDALSIDQVNGDDFMVTQHFGAHRVPALLRRENTRVSLTCESERALGPEAASARGLRLRRERAVAGLRRAMVAQVEEGLPFDEPKTEDGQEDGKLRPAWWWAYRGGATRYEWNGDRYRVFDSEGRPLVPQVCIDFITDTFERASGTWFAPKGQPRARHVGRVDLNELEMENRRSVEEFLALSERRTDLFDLHRVPPERQVPLTRRERFFTSLFEDRDKYRPGDVIVILGLRDDDKYHYHSFFVFDSDPITGMPTLVAANSGRPRIRAFSDEMESAPKRSLRARVRPKLDWLERVVLEAPAGQAPLGSAGPRTPLDPAG
jgi:hypothetical protein